MRIFRLISGITLLSGSGWLGPVIAGLLDVSSYEVYAGKKTVKVGRF